MRTDQRRSTFGQPSRLVAVVTASVAWLLVALPVVAASGTYRNPLEPRIPGDGIAENCPDPTVMWGAEGEGLWFMYCTSDPRNDEDRDANGDFIFHLLPTYSSPDLVTWTYRGDALGERPEYAFPDAFIWAPDIVYAPEVGEYRLYYSVVDADVNGGGSAIGVATAPTPLGPWTQSDEPVIEPHPADCCGEESRRVTIDPEVLRTAGADYIYYGSFFGGVSVRVLSEDGLRSDPATQTNVAIANKFEAPEIVHKDGWYYLFLSATGCCNGPQTGYAVLVGRSQSPTGPFLDRHGIDLNANEGPDAPPPTDGRAGGTPVIYQNGNRWVGPGHNTMLRDFAGQWWTVYHAIDVTEPYFADAVGFTKRSPMLDAIDWIDGWPTLNGGRGPSDTPQHAPAAQPGQRTSHHVQVAPPDREGRTIWADPFDSSTPTGWTWIRESNVTACATGQLCMEIQDADLFGDTNDASVLVRGAPSGDWVVETKVRVDVPVDGCCFNYAQAGLIVYEDDDNYIKLVNASIWNTRQTEYAREIGPVPADYPFYGNSVIGPPGDWTWLRIVKRTTGRHTAPGVFGGKELYTAYTSPNGRVWDRGATWAHDLGKAVRVGIVAMGVVPEDEGGPPSGETYTAAFDYVRVSRVTR